MRSSSFSFGNPFIIDFFVLFSCSQSSFPSFDFVFLLNSFSSNSDVGDQSLDLGCFLSQWGIWILLALESSSDDVLFNQGSDLGWFLTFGLWDTEKFSYSWSSFWTQSSWLNLVSKSGNLFLSFLNNSAGKHFNIRTDDAASNGFSLSFSFSLGTISFGSGLEEESDSTIREDALFHGKSITVKSACDFKYVSLELISKRISLNFLAHTFFKEVSPAIGIVDNNGFGCSVFWEW